MKTSLFVWLAERLLDIPAAGRFYAQKVKRTLHILYPSQDLEEVCRLYYREKMALMFRIIGVGGLLILLVMISEYSSSLKKKENVLQRGEESMQITLEVQTERSDKTEVVYNLKPRFYTPEQILEYVNRFSTEGESLILGENESLEQVDTDLFLQESYEGYPMEFSWESSDYARIAEDGTVENKELKEQQLVQLTVRMTYEEQVHEQTFSVCVIPQRLNDSQRREGEILSVLRKADEEQKYTEQFQLPEKIAGESAEYDIPGDNTSMLMCVALPAVLAAVYGAKDRDLEKELERRKKRMSLRYPEFVSKVQLLLGAGVSVRNVLVRLSEDSSLGEELQGELEILVRDLKNGMSLRDALDRFGKRTANPLYIKFSALLIQNMKKGTDDLMTQISGEVSEAFVLRETHARQLGEEAGTKLLAPMILMLVVVMTVLMIPAFLSFQL